MLKQYNQIHSGEKLQRIEKDGGKFVCRDGLEGRNPQEEEENSLELHYFINNSIKKFEIQTI
jgi:hypothetical protein